MFVPPRLLRSSDQCLLTQPQTRARIYFNCRTGHPSLTSCTDSYIGLTFAIGWGSRSVFSSSNASTGWPPGTSPITASRCQYRPLAPPCVRPGFRSAFSSSLERELRLSALRGFFHASPAVWNSLPDDLRDPELSIGIFRLKTFLFSQIWLTTSLELVVHLLSFHFFLISSIVCRARQRDILLAGAFEMSWLIDWTCFQCLCAKSMELATIVYSAFTNSCNVQT